MRHPLILLTALLLAPPGALDIMAAPDGPRPNILFIFADDWGWGDLSCHGHPYIKTPNLDRLAAEGVDFQQFNVLSPVCSPSRVAAITGRFPARYSIREALEAAPAGNREKGQCDWLDPKAVTTARLLKQAGYATGHFGKWHLGQGDEAPLPEAYGYDEYATWTGPRRETNEKDFHGVFDKTIAFIRAHKDRPFYVDLWMHETHAPQVPTDESMKQYAHLDEQHRPYAAATADGDKGVGRVLAVLKELGLEERTLVIFSSDNGPERTGQEKQKELRGGYGTYYSTGSTGGLRGRKRSLYEGGVRVPFIVRWPGHAPPGIRNDRTSIAAVDLLPTLCAAAGVSLPADFTPDGENLLAAFTGWPVARTRPIFWEWGGFNAEPDWWPRLALRDGDWKLVMDNDGKRVELHQLLNDRAEAGDSAKEHPEIVARLTKLALEWKATLPKQPDPACVTKGDPGKARSTKKPRMAEQPAATKPSPDRPAPDRAKVFERWNTNMDGELTIEEYKAGLKDKKNAEKRFANFDKNGDGKLSREEFVHPSPK